jgi:hypothetical protein
MRRIKLFLLLAILVVLGSVLLVSQRNVATANSSGSCKIHDFQVEVRHGPTQGMLLSGTLSLSADYNGVITGSLLSGDHQVFIKVSGTVNGYALNLAFDLGYSGRTQTYIFGSGTLSHAFPDCSGLSGGLLQGPQKGDSGEWSVGNGAI